MLCFILIKEICNRIKSLSCCCNGSFLSVCTCVSVACVCVCVCMFGTYLWVGVCVCVCVCLCGKSNGLLLCGVQRGSHCAFISRLCYCCDGPRLGVADPLFLGVKPSICQFCDTIVTVKHSHGDLPCRPALSQIKRTFQPYHYTINSNICNYCYRMCSM